MPIILVIQFQYAKLKLNINGIKTFTLSYKIVSTKHNVMTRIFFLKYRTLKVNILFYAMFYKNAVRLLLAINNHRAINYVTINTLVHSYSALTLAHYRFKIHISLSMDQEICLKKHNALKKKFYKATQRNKQYKLMQRFFFIPH